MEKYNFDFDESAARLGREVRTKSGKLVRIVSFDAGCPFNILGIVHIDSQTDYPLSFNRYGVACGSSNVSDALDLVCPIDNYDFHKSQDLWINVFQDDEGWYTRNEKIYRTKLDAGMATANVSLPHKTLKIKL